ncbi:TraX family protein, partial [Klebsiella pneumoniae]|uniref:TraX family protein n=1 Tax=Klebsiella pneumoniae TaxID=573 RepID=UPI000B307F09
TLPDDPQFRRQEEAIQQVASERLQREGMNLARHAEIRQSQLNSLWGWALVAQVSFMLIGYPWYTGNILFAFAVTGQVLRWVSQPSWYYTL